MVVILYILQSFFCFKPKKADVVRSRDWSSDVSSADREGAGADAGAGLQEAGVVAGDGAGADVGGRADRGIAEIGEVVRLGALAELGVLDLDEVADVGGATDARARAQAREGTEHHIVADLGALQMAEAADPDADPHAAPGAANTDKLTPA